MWRRVVSLALMAVFAAGAGGAGSRAGLVVHEWGTITTVHTPDGIAMGGLNQIDESDVLPAFVHRWEPESTRHDPKLRLAKVPLKPGRPDVTMRLETPVIYFHPDKRGGQQPIDVTVRFRGGVINEFYPQADATVALDVERIVDKQREGVLPRKWTGEVLNNYVVGSLTWRGLELHDTVVAPLTDDPVWLAPRAVEAASVYLPHAGEGERYLFYRGVAALPALLQTRVERSQVQILAPAQLAWLEIRTLTVPGLWLADVRDDGAIAFREQGPVTYGKADAGKPLLRLKLMGASEATAERARELRASLKAALIEQGLYADEAEAMLNTWKASYFERPGLRIFYVVPRAWTDHFLPLTLSAPARVERVIIGRIDLAPATISPGA